MPLAASLIVYGVVCAGVGVLVGHALGARKRKLSHPGELAFDATYFAHPERLFKQVDADLDVLSGNDRLDVTVRVELKKGWEQVKRRRRAWDLRLHGSPAQIKQGLRAALMDDDCRLIAKGNNNRQNDATHPELFNHRKESQVRISWWDSDSPVKVTIRARVRGPAVLPVEREDPALIAAREEVNDHLAEALAKYHEPDRRLAQAAQRYAEKKTQ